MSSSGSVTQWIERLKAGDHEAAQSIWEGYYRRLIGLARKQLGGLPRRAADEDDVVLSAFDSFCRGAEQGRFPKLADRADLWQLLVMITARKASDLVHRERRQKRGGGAVLDEGALEGPADCSSQEGGLDLLAGNEPTPAFAAEVADQLRWLLDHLREPELQTVALRKLEGYSHEEIAAQLGCAIRTVERKLWRIRSLWRSEVADD